LKICCISDTHQHHKKVKIPLDIDVVVHAGDFTYHGTREEVDKFINWYATIRATKVLICGNHEVEISKDMDYLREKCNEHNIILLEDSSVEIKGLKFYGSPYSNQFGNWAFMKKEYELEELYKQIPDDVDVLITHGPAYMRLDKCPNGNVGSVSLRKRIDKLEHIKLHITGHIHESRGVSIEHADHHDYVTVNASICGIPYSDVLINPIVIKI